MLRHRQAKVNLEMVCGLTKYSSGVSLMEFCEMRVRG